MGRTVDTTASSSSIFGARERILQINRFGTLIGDGIGAGEPDGVSSRTSSKPCALIDGNNGILTKLDKFLNLLRQHVSSSSNNSENTSLCLSVSYLHI